jgi:hypothetical protein
MNDQGDDGKAIWIRAVVHGRSVCALGCIEIAKAGRAWQKTPALQNISSLIVKELSIDQFDGAECMFLQ